MESPFDVLRIDPDADDDEVDRAYRRRVLEAHPDHGGSPREFQRVRAAYERIEAGYEPDDAGSERGNGAGAGDPPDPGPGARDPAGRSTGRAGRGPGEASDDSDEPDESRVEYLNYEVLDDRGWGLGDPDLFEKASDADLDPADYGMFLVEPGESLLEAAENRGFAWPYACRGGACANCAVAVVEGEMETPGNHILSEEMVAHGIRLSCISAPQSAELKVVYNVKHLPDLDELRLPADRFERAQATD
ncbi:ferredoxin Fer [Candidatus Halobonum tyrrellensis]|uniref:DnaJ N-terminal domain-containing protein n=1 Tax=Candidatus Halobonum tyrrellensis G22 TaxID=1324957 RepID=V4HJE2_9EURY|nr:ferredoxin Fer [Candidatus Halobonum tyrrellensis]ESP88039.1 DnaJ N-terminal domain-containing protein [Candidatus Halobonum tyrrellensis G22]